MAGQIYNSLSTKGGKKMGYNSPILVSFLFLSISLVTCSASNEDFFQCMAMHSMQENLYNPLSQTYVDLFQLAQQNTRWLNTSSPKPLFIFTPTDELQIQAAVTCSRRHNLQIRVKSGGHDYEGVSFLSQNPYVIIDLVKFKDINIDLGSETAWVQTGATLGELYYSIAKKSLIHAFPGGTCPSVGTGGHISGGGFGMLARKYGLAADNVIDARLIDVNGRILNRKAMGEDLFWAIRGSGGASYGVITAWKLKLVRVPSTVTALTLRRYLNESASKLVYKWQFVADKLPEDLLVRIFLEGKEKESTILAKFNSVFLGTKQHLIKIMNEKFPELGLQQSDCYEMTWINSTVFDKNKAQPLEKLLSRVDPYKTNYKGKSDFVTTPIPESGLEGLWKLLIENPSMLVIFDPFGGKFDEIAESELPFPHRKGNLFNIQYLNKWKVNNASEIDSHVQRARDIYKYMEPYVSHSPRSAYINYKDFDLGINRPDGKTSYSEALVWGEKYFKGNFERLARVKSQVDPENFFRNEQSIPVLHV